jgi:hypothetical protein
MNWIVIIATLAALVLFLEIALSPRIGLFVFGFCPECNSDAPELDTCPVCNGYRWSRHGGPPSRELRKAWWQAYKELHATKEEKQC